MIASETQATVSLRVIASETQVAVSLRVIVPETWTTVSAPTIVSFTSFRVGIMITEDGYMRNAIKLEG